jgi:signal transduction histidine kinase
MNDSTMLIGAEAGLYELTNGNYIPYKISGGTIHAAVYSILQANGYIYVGTNDGVFYFNRSGELFQHGRGGTLVGTEINRSALIEDSYGRIWIGTERGATCYDREYDNVTALPPRVVLTGVEGADGLLHSMSEDVSFPRSSNALRFHFYAPSFIQENLLEYEYKLTGIDTAFRTATQARLDEIRYVHLPSGKYFFEARARNKNGVWGPVARSAEIHISAPFYLSVWFMALVLIVAGGGYYVWRKYHAGVRYRLQLEAAVTDRTKALRDSHEELMKLNRELEARVAERTKELEKLNRSKDRFFSIIAHDLKSPFQGLLGFSDLLLNEYYSHNDSERLEFLARLHQLSQKSYALLENLLQWSRLQTNRIKPDPGYFKIHDIVENVNDLLLAQASVKNISLVNNTDPSAAAFGDLTMTSQAIQNLVSNAIKFSHSDSSVVIESGADDSRWTEVLVVDKGVGIKPEDGEKLFRIEVQHSSTGTNNEKGTGIGLLIAKDLVELNKGAISFTSIPGEGTTFRIKLPRQQP